MSRIPGIRRLFHLARTRAGIQRAVDDELQFHFDMTMRDLMSGGMTPDDARREAQRRFGNVEQTRDRLATIDRALADQERRAEWWSAFAQDLRYALRGLRLKPGFAIAVILTLGLGIGANATMFGIIDRLLFRPPAFLHAPERVARLYIVHTYTDGTADPESGLGYRRYADFREWTQSFDAMTPFYSEKLAVGIGDATAEMRVGVSGADLWTLFDVKPVIGRFFTADEDVPPSGTPVVVLSYAFWQTQFGGRQSVIGTKVDIGPGKYTVIGVAPKDFTGFEIDPVVAFLPISAQKGAESFKGWNTTYGMVWFDVFARRKPGVSIASATAELTNAYLRSYRAQIEENPRTRPIAVAKPHAFVGPVLYNRGPNQTKETTVATWLAGVAGIVLLIACANVANLLLARAVSRRREIAVRVALGVSRARLLTQLMVESLLLAVIGGFAGLAIAQYGGAIVRRSLLNQGAGPGALTDARVVGVAIALATLAGLLTGLAPALQAGRTDVASALKAGSREGTTQRSVLRASLLMAQAALSVMLLVGAGLFVRSLVNVQSIRLGYDTEQLLWVDPILRNVKLDTIQSAALRQSLLERAQSIPGVERASRAISVPLYSMWQPRLYIAGIDTVSKLGGFAMQAGSPSFFATLGTRILRGRGIGADDRRDAPKIMVVSAGMAKRLWPNDDAIGKCVRVNTETAPCTTVLGVAEDVRNEGLTGEEFQYYLPIDQFGPTRGGLFIRTSGPAATQADRIRRALQQVMPGASYVTTTPMTTIVGGRTRSWRLGATMFVVFGGLALLLAAIGLYSVIAYNVTQRTHEMGVRVALGAQSRDVIQLIVREGLQIVVPGVVVGALGAIGAGRWIAPLLFGTSPKDPSVLAGVIVALLVVAVSASWIPAMRASRVDPNEALRAD
jgi:putative ABC transport system permease protein